MEQTERQWHKVNVQCGDKKRVERSSHCLRLQHSARAETTAPMKEAVQLDLKSSASSAIEPSSTVFTLFRTCQY